ncbi:hypothetical protein CU097_005053 [Rhizopus azygosporus]|uniref:UBA domain-containing protein n=1 Tax=Rhizopus azygosporus TaxID=86630 RepID=A0A367JP79_RHIAZ|nr:hypothetical protein CU097_005053 [Rhizopus azygosporus]
MSQTSGCSTPDNKSSANVPKKPPRSTKAEYASTECKRHYASPEESDDAIPIFTTPTNMYIRDELNPRPRFTSPRPRHQYTYSPSPSSQYSNTSFDPLSTKYHSNNNTPSYSPKADTNFNTRPKATSFSNKERMNGSTQQTPTHSGNNFTNSAEPSTHKDLILAQLVEMGFALDACKAALASCSTNASLQDVLDILVQSTTTSDQQVPLDPGAVSSEEEDIGISSEEAWKQEQERRRKEYLNELKRNSQTVDTGYAEKQRKEGNYYFNKGLFIEAESSYSLAIASLPAHHSAIVLLSNNRAAARLKLGKYQACLDDCSTAIQLASKNVATNAIVIEGVSSWKSQWLKALHRKACALEGLGLYDAAIHVYEEYARTSGVPRTAIVNQGIQRCQDAMQAKKEGKTKNNGTHSPIWKPSKESSTAFPDIDFTMFMPKQPQPQANMDEINASKAVREMREREKKREAEEAERLAKEDKVNAQLVAWKNGKEQNLRSLLASLELILWSDIQWKGVTVGELLEPKKCKVTYMKAIAKVHPDKLPANATVEQRLLASGIFTTLNQAWDTFRTEHNL